MTAETWLIPDRIMLRPSEDGSFDELFVYENGEVVVHMEMMDDNRLWIGLFPLSGNNRGVHVNIMSRKKLKIAVEES